MLTFSQFLKEEYGKIHHTWWGRGNPIHRGHELGVNEVVAAAKKDGGSHSIVFTGSQDAKKNPLTPEQKLKHARRAFPGVNVETTTKDAPTLLHHLSKLHKQGVREFHLHVGSDRVDEFNNLLHKYNGVEGKHGYYNMRIKVHAVGGERKEGGGGVEAASATKMREAAKSGDKKAFAAMAPSKMKPEHKEEMYNDVRKGMGLDN